MYVKTNIKKYIICNFVNKKDKILISLKFKYQKFKLKKLISVYMKSKLCYLNRNANNYYEKLTKRYNILENINSIFSQNFYTRYGSNWRVVFYFKIKKFYLFI